MESGMDMMAADTAPERSPFIFTRCFFRFIFIPAYGEAVSKPLFRLLAAFVPAERDF
jgi:hypothetical protein